MSESHYEGRMPSMKWGKDIREFRGVAYPSGKTGEGPPVYRTTNCKLNCGRTATEKLRAEDYAKWSKRLAQRVNRACSRKTKVARKATKVQAESTASPVADRQQPQVKTNGRSTVGADNRALSGGRRKTASERRAETRLAVKTPGCIRALEVLNG